MVPTQGAPPSAAPAPVPLPAPAPAPAPRFSFGVAPTPAPALRFSFGAAPAPAPAPEQQQAQARHGSGPIFIDDVLGPAGDLPISQTRPWEPPSRRHLIIHLVRATNLTPAFAEQLLWRYDWNYPRCQNIVRNQGVSFIIPD